MKRVIDVRGLQCPMPLIQAKQAMEEVSTIEIYVDNEIAVQNLIKLAQQKQYTIYHNKQDEHTFLVELSKNEIENQMVKEEQNNLTNKVVVIASNKMGEGDDVLGNMLMKGFIYALTQLKELPSSVLFYNSGVFLTTQESEIIQDLQVLIDKGVEVLSCGLCLQHYQLQDKLLVGDVTNMYMILEKQMQAEGIIRP